MRCSSNQKAGYRKNATVIFLAVAFLFGWWSALFLPASAAETEPQGRILAGLLACDGAIDLSDCSLRVSELGQIYASLLHSHPELFHVAPRLSFRTRDVVSDGGIERMVTEIYPIYIQTGQDLTAARAFFRDTVTAILTEMDAVLGNRSRTEAETVLYLHDLLADRYAYDTRTESPNADAYSFLHDGRGICQAYALAFMALARGAGLEADFVSSDDMDHAWNHVRVEGAWYHVDVTRDDPIPAASGGEAVNHDRLLRSDAGMEALGYHGYTCAAGHICTDRRFETEGRASLAGFRTALIPFGEHWVGENGEGAPVGIAVEKDGITVGKAGDMDGDGEVTPADLLRVYDPLYPEAWREWLREMLTKGA